MYLVEAEIITLLRATQSAFWCFLILLSYGGLDITNKQTKADNRPLGRLQSTRALGAGYLRVTH